MIKLLDTYTDTLIGPERKNVSLSELIEHFSIAWASHFNEHRMFLALRCDLVAQLLEHKKAFNIEINQLSKYTNNNSIQHLSTAISTCPFYLDVVVRRLLLRALAVEILDPA